MKGLKICIVGVGHFSRCFVPLYQAHPLVAEVSFCDLDADKMNLEAARFGVTRLFRDLGDVLASDVDAVAIFTQRWTHAPLALRALAAGKHVYSAVPAATTLEDLDRLVAAVRGSGLIYMMGETTCYSGNRLYCLEQWKSGALGHFVYGEGEYYHDMSHGMYSVYQRGGGEAWKTTASFPPMLYPTHSVAMVLSVTGARATSVACLGWKDRSDDGIYDRKTSRFENDFSNQTMLCRTSDGGIARINEFRRCGTKGGRNVRLSLFGTEGSYEENAFGAMWCSRAADAVSVEDQIKCEGVYSPERWEELKVEVELRGDYLAGFAPVHRKYRERLPESYRTQPNGHEGSHQFLTDDFVTAVATGRQPPINVWEAARFNAPGIVAHASSLREGEWMSVPDFGSPPPVFASALPATA
jgi:predicted dehydrogenase